MWKIYIEVYNNSVLLKYTILMKAVLFRLCEWLRPLWTPRHTWDGKAKMDFKEMGVRLWTGIVVPGLDQPQTLLHKSMKLRLLQNTSDCLISSATLTSTEVFSVEFSDAFKRLTFKVSGLQKLWQLLLTDIINKNKLLFQYKISCTVQPKTNWMTSRTDIMDIVGSFQTASVV